jgi:hypothetical protein
LAISEGNGPAGKGTVVFGAVGAGGVELQDATLTAATARAMMTTSGGHLRTLRE